MRRREERAGQGRNRSPRSWRRPAIVLAAAALVAVAAVAALAVRAASPDDPPAPRGATGPDANPSPPAATTQPETETAPPPATTPDLAHVRGAVIAIDPGHNGGNFRHPDEINRQVDAGTLRKACDTTGTQTDGGYTEAAYNLDVARRLARILTRAGAEVVLTRTTDDGWGPCITERAAVANRANADVAVSIHADGGPADGRGFHVIYPPPVEGLTDDVADESRRLALALRAAYRTTGMPQATYIGEAGLDVRTDLGGLNLSDVPKVLLETGNMRNAEDAALLESPAFRRRAAAAIARGLDAYLRDAS